jgi:general stress protein CsbA
MNILRFLSGLYYAGMVLVLSGIIMHLADISGAQWVFATGLIPVLGIRLYNFIISAPHRKRLNGILMTSAVFLAAAVFAIYHDRSYWIIFVAVSAVLDGYVSFRKFT